MGLRVDTKGTQAATDLFYLLADTGRDLGCRAQAMTCRLVGGQIVEM
jgi:hypothetical protein